MRYLRSVRLALTVIRALATRPLSPSCVPSLSEPSDLDIRQKLSQTPWDGRHALEVNMVITAEYAKHCAFWQHTVDPLTNSTHTSARPTWFCFAPYASRVVGLHLLMLDSVRNLQVESAVRVFSRSINLGALTDPACGFTRVCWRQVYTVLDRIRRLSTPSPLKFLNTVYQLLEHGNRLICEHIIGAGERYLRFRAIHADADENVDPRAVLSAFQLGPSEFLAAGVPRSNTGTNGTIAARIYDAASRSLDDANGDQRALLEGHACSDIMVAGFACWETGLSVFRREGASELHNRWMEFGNNMFAYCEQAEAVAPAFRPGGETQPRTSVGDEETLRALEGEVSRESVMELFTVFVQLTFRGNRYWSMDEYAKNELGDHAYYASMNWGRFKDRYLPILNSFDFVYRSGPGLLWPPPHPDPRVADAGMQQMSWTSCSE